MNYRVKENAVPAGTGTAQSEVAIGQHDNAATNKTVAAKRRRLSVQEKLSSGKTCHGAIFAVRAGKPSDVLRGYHHSQIVVAWIRPGRDAAKLAPGWCGDLAARSFTFPLRPALPPIFDVDEYVRRLWRARGAT